MKRTALILVATLAGASLARAEGGGQALYEKKCASCHAKDGEAKTKMGEKLSVRPFSNAEVQKGLEPEKLTKVIVEGVPEKKMPAEKKLSEAEVKSVVEYVTATFKK